jgi:hypothetical protein
LFLKMPRSNQRNFQLFFPVIGIHIYEVSTSLTPSVSCRSVLKYHLFLSILSKWDLFCYYAQLCSLLLLCYFFAISPIWIMCIYLYIYFLSEFLYYYVNSEQKFFIY